MADPDELRSQIDASRRRLAHLTADLDDIFDFQRDAPPDDEHDIEGASVGFERARVTALLRAEEARLRQLEEAEERLRVGSYGRCERCGGDIGAERLDALPGTTTCVTCARQA